MAIRLVVTFTTQPGKATDFAQAFAPVIKEVQKEKGCEQYELFGSLDDADKLVLLERWADAASLDAHAAAMRGRGPSPTASYRAGSPTMERYEA
jgi:quinol monooxygenase YgiN